MRQSAPHVKLFIPGPTEVLPEVLDAQAGWLYGHRMPECSDLMGRIQPKLRQVFRTNHRVMISASSGSGLLEAGARNLMLKKTLNCVNGAFSDRWRDISEANGKANEILSVEWGQAVRPEIVAERLASGEFDAITVAHNETSTGVTNPIQEIAAAVRNAPNGDDIMIMVDSVSGLSGALLETDAWDLDLVVTSSQKAFALPPGLSFAAVSDRAMERAKEVPNRGYYFDFLELEKYLVKDQTPATPAISLMAALDAQLDLMMAEGMDNRYARHLAMRDRTIQWARETGFSTFAEAGYESPTLTCVRNDLNVDISALNKFLRTRGMILSNGYGAPLKNVTFRIAHMGELQMADMEALFEAVEAFLAQS